MFKDVPVFREVYHKYANGRVLAIRVDSRKKEYRFKVQSFTKESDWSMIMPTANKRTFHSLMSIPLPLNAIDVNKVASMPDAWKSKQDTLRTKDTVETI